MKTQRTGRLGARSMRLAVAAALLALLPWLAGCGAGGFLEAGVLLTGGDVVAENSTLNLPATFMVDFVLWPSYAVPGGPNLLPFALHPGEAAAVATVESDFYDAEALMSDGFFEYLETWSDVYVPAANVTTFFAY